MLSVPVILFLLHRTAKETFEGHMWDKNQICILSRESLAEPELL